jgi:uncharacterized protein YgiM (DUF1202 family)
MKKVIYLTAIAVGCLTTACFGRSVSLNISADGATPASPQAAAPSPAASPIAASPQPAPVQPAPVQAAPVQVVAPDPTAGLTNANTYFVRTNDGNGVNVRASNSAQSAKVASLAENSRVIVHSSDRSGEWLEISASNNIRGWVAARYLQSASGQVASSAPVDSNTLWVKTNDGNGVNLRADPSLSGRVLATLKDRTPVYYQDTVGQWTYVSTANGTSGYIASEYLVSQ